MIYKKIVNKIVSFSNFLGNNSFLKIENLNNLNVSKEVVIYSLAWGTYLETYFKYTLPSLLNQSNVPALIDAGFKITIELHSIDSDEKIRNKYKKELENIKLKSHNFNISVIENKNEAVGEIALNSLIKIFKYCINKKSIMFMASPDNIYCNYSLLNSVLFVYAKRKGLASPHPRINTNIFRDYKNYPENGFSSTEAVSYAFKNLHSSFKLANEELIENTVYAGISYKKLSQNLYAICSNLPSPWVVIPTKEDLDFFIISGRFVDWDRGWLSLLLKKNRIKVCGSSDMFFCMEITAENKNTILKPKKVKYPWKDLYSEAFSNRLCNSFITLWRE